MSTEAPAPGLIVVGLVGRAGSGKSRFAAVFGRRGVPVLEADLVGHRITDRDPDVRAGLSVEYGPGIYRADGTLDRARVAERVFADPEARRRLDALVHPRLVAALRAEIVRLRREGAARVALLDAALMLDWGLDRDCDLLVAVTAPEELQVERLVQSRGWTPEHARARLAVQRSNREFAERADVAIENDGPPAALEARADALLTELLRDGAARWARTKGPQGRC